MGSRYVGKAAQQSRNCPGITADHRHLEHAARGPGPAAQSDTGERADRRQQGHGESADARIADYLNNNFSGVSVSDSADNPFQLDINYHGFTASPLLGTPEGLSIYLDGVRVNESFGDTVNWDLIPQNAVSTITLLSARIRCSVSIHWEAHSRCARRADTIIPAPSSRPTAAHSGGAPSRAKPAASSAISTTSSRDLFR